MRAWSHPKSKTCSTLIERRIAEHKPVAYLTGEAWFAGLKFKSDTRALVPRSPIAELIQSGFTPWLDERPVERALDLCTGSGCIGIAMAAHNPDWQVDLADISDDALALARENIEFQDVGERVRVFKSDLFAGARRRALRPDRQQSAVRDRAGIRRAAARIQP